jgi:hypothetical protein
LFVVVVPTVVAVVDTAVVVDDTAVDDTAAMSRNSNVRVVHAVQNVLAVHAAHQVQVQKNDNGAAQSRRRRRRPPPPPPPPAASYLDFHWIDPPALGDCAAAAAATSTSTS